MAAVNDTPAILGLSLALSYDVSFPAGAGEGDYLYVDANTGLAIPGQEGDWLQVDVNCGLAIPSQDGDWLQVDGDLIYGAGKVQYPWREASDGSTSPAGRY
jgi:hypothetical protein